jgi:phosphate ABC transporter phosphate-binding protein
MTAAPEGPPSTSTPAPTSAPEPSRPVVRRRRERGTVYAIVGTVVVVVILVAVGYSTSWYGLQKSSSPTPCSSGITLQGDGAQVAAPLMGVWTPAYHQLTNNTVNYPASGSGTGLTHFTAGTLDFGVTDDPLSASQVSALPTPALTLPFVGGALTIIYNLPALTGHLNLTGAILAGIYNGTITTWDDPALVASNPHVTLPSNTIAPVVRSDAAGTTYVFTDFLSQSSTWWAVNVGKGISVAFPHVTAEKAVHGNSAVISTVTGTSYTIGYSDLTDVLASSTPPQYAAIQNPAGNYIVPTIANTESAIADKVASMASIPPSTGNWYSVSMVKANGTTDYPIATFIYMFVFQAGDKGYSPTLAKTQVIVQWLHWVLSTGQLSADETQPTPLYYAPLPSPIVSVDLAGIQTMTYNGAAIPACK